MRWIAGTALLVLVSTAAPVPAQPGGAAAAVPARWRVSVSPTIGGVMLDGDLADYRWDTQVAVQPGLRAALHRSRFAAGVRAAWFGTSQATGIPGESTVPEVHMTEVDLVLEAWVARTHGVELWASGHGGRLHMGYDPDHLTVDLGGPSEPVTVDYEPITEWCYGLGIEFRFAVARQLALGLQLEQTSFQLDTAHRSGDEIVESRERFTNWGLSLAVLGFADLD
jgi:hypothetical protein